VSPPSPGLAFGLVLLALAASPFALRRAPSRAFVAVAAAAPFAAWLGYEWIVHRATPYADVRVDWVLLLPIAWLHLRYALARWRRLD